MVPAGTGHRSLPAGGMRVAEHDTERHLLEITKILI
jgi:hypothetical protein